jgi:hypothetical protein
MTTPRDLAIPLERITWRDGQTLTSSDLRSDWSYADRLRYLHVRYQHKTWGVVEGLNVTSAGIATVIVSPGYALNIEGVELLLPAKTGLSVPKTVASTTMYLVIARAANPTACAATPDLATLCPGVRNPIPLEQGQISWKTVNQVQLGRDVLLARVLVAGGQLTSAVDTSIQNRASGMNPPLIWADVTQSGQTGWSAAREGNVAEIQATVDTSDAGFIETPAYFARLTGTSRVASAFVAQATPTSFTFVLRTPAIFSGIYAYTQFSAATAENGGWTIAWCAIEVKKGLWI